MNILIACEFSGIAKAMAEQWGGLYPGILI